MSRPARHQLYCRTLKPGALDYLTRDEILHVFEQYDQVEDLYRPAGAEYFFVELSSREGVLRALHLQRINQFFVHVGESSRNFFPGDRMAVPGSRNTTREPLPEYERDRFGAKAATLRPPEGGAGGRRWGRVEGQGGREWDKGKVNWIDLKKGSQSEERRNKEMRSRSGMTPMGSSAMRVWGAGGGEGRQPDTPTASIPASPPARHLTNATKRPSDARRRSASPNSSTSRSRSPTARARRNEGRRPSGSVAYATYDHGESRRRPVEEVEENSAQALEEKKREMRRKEALEVALTAEEEEVDEDGMLLEQEGCEDSLEDLEARLHRDTRILIIRNLAEECTLLKEFGSQDDLRVVSAGAHAYFSGEGFIEWSTPDEATRALLTLNGRKILGVPIRLKRV
ncbi:hypothetical protein BCR35DRAFT_353865 [Leucosporidium creatinivorum]|uniref:RRM domain-containing protein n=1 Tax=Leucosporidium creatinivorum TaxID=106004 RepID=A0A1Y2ESL4_9BASI|nr:hypothetical protein BCR35DRAFT_353865 [Leucosporidium creatinivorum]